MRWQGKSDQQKGDIDTLKGKIIEGIHVSHEPKRVDLYSEDEMCVCEQSHSPLTLYSRGKAETCFVNPTYATNLGEGTVAQ